MFVIFLYVILYGILEKVLYLKYSKLKAYANTFDKMMELRRKYNRDMKGFSVGAFVFSYLVEWFYNLVTISRSNYTFIENDADILEFIVSMIFSIGVALLIHHFRYKKHVLKKLLSASTVQEFLQEQKKFIFYLRSFESDIYEGSPIKIFEHENDEIMPLETFVESDLVTAIKETTISFPVYAVGMTKEFFQPKDSAIRVYTDDEHWQIDVLDMIKEAEFVYVLVSSRKSCLWEIRQLREYLNKTVFIVDDFDSYEQARAQLRNEMFLPDVTNELSLFPQVFLYWENGEYTVHGFGLSSREYKKLVCPAIEKLCLRQLDIVGLFKPINESLIVSWLDDCNSALEKVCESVVGKCPIRINPQFVLTGCELNESQLILYYKAESEIFRDIKCKSSSFQWLLDNILCDEISDGLKSVITMCANKVVLNIYDNENDGVSRFVIEVDEM